MTKDEFDQHCARVTEMMEEYVAQFVTPLSMSDQFGSGTAWGQGRTFKDLNTLGS